MADPDLDQARRIIFAAMKETGLDASQLAKAAGVSHSTLTRPLYDPDWKYVPSTRTMNKIMSAVTRLRLMGPLSPPPKPTRPARRRKPRSPAPAAAKRGRR